MIAQGTGIKAEFLSDGCCRLLSGYHRIPEGFVWDGASIPRYFWRMFGHPYDRHHLRGGLKHDFNYQEGIMSRSKCDRIYYHDIREDRQPFILACLEWLVLRIFGWLRYNHARTVK